MKEIQLKLKMSGYYLDLGMDESLLSLYPILLYSIMCPSNSHWKNDFF